MKFVIETEQVIRRTYEVEAPGHVAARDFLSGSRTAREPFQREQRAEREVVSRIQRVRRLDVTTGLDQISEGEAS